MFDYLVVGAGFAGATMAERLAADGDKKVLVCERRAHVGGNAYDHYDDAGILVHKYGPHIFHTNSREVYEYLSRFTDWRPYQHSVLAWVDGQLLPVPINLNTVNRMYGTSFTSFEVEQFFRSVAEPTPQIKTSEDVIVSKVGRELYEKFFRNYTRKQWGLDPSELDAQVIARVPVRTNCDNRYFTDTYQVMPKHGYTKMFDRLLSHPNINILLNADYRHVRSMIPHREVIFTGPIDEYFDYRYGRLPYRSIEFRFETHNVPVAQAGPVINYPNENAYTRITEFKYLTGQEHTKTTVVYEYPQDEGDPYYPIPRPENQQLYRRYQALAEQTTGVHFLGRLGTYKYYNMDQCVAQALSYYRKVIAPTTVALAVHRVSALELWGGIESTVNRVGDRYHDQIIRSGHQTRPDDLDVFASCGFTALRYPVLWERVAPLSITDCDWTWTDLRLNRIRDLGMRPIAGLLHHGSGPAYTSLLDPDFPATFAAYARAAAERYPWVVDWTPVNEPLTTARFSGLYGHWYPHATSDASFVRALLNQLRGTVLAMRAIRAVNPAARLIQTEDCGTTFGSDALASQVAFDQERRWLTWDFLSGRVDDTHPLAGYLRQHGASAGELAEFVEVPCPPALLGLNYYLTSDRWLDERIEQYPSSAHGGNGHLQYADVDAVRGRPDGIVGHRAHLMEAWERYGTPTALTEVHLGCTREEQMRWLVSAWTDAGRARDEGAIVEAVTAWALLGSYEWDSLVTEVRGHYEPGVFDVRSPRPRPTALAQTVAELGGSAAARHPVLASGGWWQRSDRLTNAAPLAAPAALSPAAPLLIIGASGTLGHAIQRVCRGRGLATHMVTRGDLEMSDPGRVDAVLRRVQPWAVINAAGYVRVDDAEYDRDACWRDNVTGPVTLAAACRRRALPFVTFSSDLVFDGRLRRPYVESDQVNPLNTYGLTKAEVETRVRDVLPSALIIRTSAFFGPWDVHNFGTQLLNTLANDGSWGVCDHGVVSPTYVPDLVSAVLDLLIDGERGVWHLANDGATSWLMFGRNLASRLGFDPARVQAVLSPHPLPAERPLYSVLRSERGTLLRSLDLATDAYCAEMAIRLTDDCRRISR